MMNVKKPFFRILLTSAAICVPACGEVEKPFGSGGSSSRPASNSGEFVMTMTLTSETVSQNQPIPRKHTGDGEDVSPSLRWSDVPEGCTEFALIMDDPDAPTEEPWVHWVLYKISADTNVLPENVLQTETLSTPAGAIQGENSWGTIGYRGPAPPKGHGVHHYQFKLYALDAALSLQPGLDKESLLEKISGHILGKGELIGTYER